MQYYCVSTATVVTRTRLSVTFVSKLPVMFLLQTVQTRGGHVFRKFRNHVRILGARRWIEAISIFKAPSYKTTWRPGFVHSWFRSSLGHPASSSVGTCDPLLGGCIGHCMKLSMHLQLPTSLRMRGMIPAFRQYVSWLGV